MLPPCIKAAVSHFPSQGATKQAPNMRAGIIYNSYNASPGQLAKQGFDFVDGHFDGVVVWRIRRQADDSCSSRFNELVDLS